MPKKMGLPGATIALATLAVATAAALPAKASGWIEGSAGVHMMLAAAPISGPAPYLATLAPFSLIPQLPVVYESSRKGLRMLSEAVDRAYAGKELDRTMTGSVPSSFFGTVAIPFSPIGSRADWDRVRSAAPVSDMKTCATPACRFRLASVRKALKSGGGESFFEKLSAVNQLVNRSIRYAPDQVTYGRLDHWADSSETVRVGSGDCEDFAILKMSLLREMGVPAKSISLVILRDTARDLYHAVLAISTNKGHFILDNMRDEVYRDVAVRNYLPLYSFSADRSWIHGKPAGELVASAPSSLSLGSIAPGESAGAVLDLANALNGLGLDLRPTAAF